MTQIKWPSRAKGWTLQEMDGQPMSCPACKRTMYLCLTMNPNGLVLRLYLNHFLKRKTVHNHCSCIRMRRFRDSLACIYSTEPSSSLSICDIQSQPAKRPFSWPSRFDSKIRFGASLFHFIYGFSFSNGRAHFLRIERVWRGITWRLDKGHTFRQDGLCGLGTEWDAVDPL